MFTEICSVNLQQPDSFPIAGIKHAYCKLLLRAEVKVLFARKSASDTWTHATPAKVLFSLSA